MKTLLARLALVTLAGLAGCTQGTPGGPGATSKEPVFGQADQTFNLSVPVMASSVRQGESTEAVIGIKRGKNFDEDVTLNMGDLPTGVTVDPARPMIKHGETETKITFKASDAAALGDFTLKIAGHPTKGAEAKVEFKLNVAGKGSFTLSVPRSSTSIKQGETRAISVSLARDKGFDQDVTLKFGDLPTGVTIDPNATVIKRGETDANITLKASPDAALGNFSIKVTGHSTQGADTTREFMLAVEPK